MGNKLYVGNLPFSVTEDSLQQLFSQSGKVERHDHYRRDTGGAKVLVSLKCRPNRKPRTPSPNSMGPTLKDGLSPLTKPVQRRRAKAVVVA